MKYQSIRKTHITKDLAENMTATVLRQKKIARPDWTYVYMEGYDRTERQKYEVAIDNVLYDTNVVIDPKIMQKILDWLSEENTKGYILLFRQDNTFKYRAWNSKEME